MSMRYALRKLDTNVYSVINLTENKVVGTFRNDVRIRFDKNKKTEYITLYRYVGKEVNVLYVLQIDNIDRIEKVVNNTIDFKDLSNSKNKFLTISNFYKESYELNYIKSNSKSASIPIEQKAAKISTFNLQNEDERVYIPGVLKIDNNKQEYENVNLNEDMVLIKTNDSVKSLSFSDLVNVLISADAKGKTIWDLGKTASVDESDYGTNPNWQ